MTQTNGRFWGYAGRFVLVHVVVYTLIATIFTLLQDALPSTTQTALETLGPYHTAGVISTPAQVVRALIVALVLYPFYDTIVRGRRGLLILFGALWGVALLGSVEPMPGSIEGFIYTETPLLAHFLALAVVAVEVFLFSWFFLRWERQSSAEMDCAQEEVVSQDKRVAGYVTRFTIVHVFTYAAAGILLFTLQDYADAFAIQERFELYRPLDDPIIAAAIPIQILRGALLAIFFLPFYDTFLSKSHGWLLLFGLTFGLIALGGANFFTGVLTDIVNRTAFSEFLIGPIEITIQMLLFSLLLFAWERRRARKLQAQPVN
ncbi:MAG TPA: hypothetical protein VK879_11895 [Candidatus Sulfomarinibacteraceae bacterium]|nr:hypothetical protein [Candidatus Sulfomarinibacteraceae bacterium]